MTDPHDAAAGPAPAAADDDLDATLSRLRAELDTIDDLPLAERAESFEAINDTLAAELGRLDGA